MSYDATFKMNIFGDGGVGKTSLVIKYLTGLFAGNQTMTIGVDFHVKKLTVEGKKVVLQIWDFAGQDRFRFLLPTYVRGAKGGIFMYDITRYSSLENISLWFDVLKAGGLKEESAMPILMVGGKLDLESERVVSKEEALEVAKNYGFVGCIECSAKTGQNVEALFIQITKTMLEGANLL